MFYDSIREMRKQCAACMALVLLLTALVLSTLAGCAFLIQPTRPDDIATYNTQIFQLATQIITLLGTLAGVIGLWIKTNKDKREITDKTEEVVKPMAATVETAAAKVEDIEKNTRRAPARSTDKTEGASDEQE